MDRYLFRNRGEITVFDRNKEQSAKLLKKLISSLFFIVLLMVVVWGIIMPANVDTTITAHQWTAPQWEQVTTAGNIPLDDLQDYHPVADGEPLVFQTLLQEKTLGKHLLFYTENQEVEVLLGGEVIYQFTTPEEAAMLQTPGNVWNNIDLPPDAAGQLLEIRLYCPFADYQGVFHPVQIIDAGAVLDTVLAKISLRLFVALIMVIIGVISLVSAILWHERTLRDYMFGSGYLTLTIGLWLLAELDFYTFLSGRSIVSYLLSMLLVRILPIAFCYFISTVIPKRTWWSKILSYVAVANLASAVIFQFVFQVSFLRMQNFFAWFIVCASVFYIIGLLHTYIKSRNIHHHNHAYYASIVFMISLFGEMYCYTHYTDYGDYLGLPLAYAAIVYAIVSHVLMVNHESRAEVEQQQLKRNYTKLQSKPLMQQINAHFLFNSLNAISAFCKEDPVKADQTVRMVARYMRAYMHLINQGGCVAFAKELELMQSYFDIQKMRFGDTIDFLVDTHFQDFALPPLTVQPLIENAVRHGVRKSTAHGIVIVHTYEEDGYAFIVVEDNGVGFDPSTMSRGIGLENVVERLHAVDSTLNINSTIDKGTSIVIKIPIHCDILEKEES